jgi:uroporphyrinogen decarboxylase
MMPDADKLTRKQRIAAVLAGQEPDRLPVSVWGHNFLREWSAVDLADETINLYRRYGYDFVKINPRWTIYAEPWGNRYEPPVAQTFPAEVCHVVHCADNLATVAKASADHPSFREHVEAVRLVVDEIGGEVDTLATVFSPLAVAGLLTGVRGLELIEMAQQAPDNLHGLLDHVTETLIEHARALIEAGVSGIFYAPLKWTSLKTCTAEFYAEFARPYDLRLLEAIRDARFNMLHVCGNHIGLERFFDYPVAALNWDNFGEGNPSLREVHSATDKVVAGGIPHLRIHKLSDRQLLEEATMATDGLTTRTMLAGGCAIGAEVGEGPRGAVVQVARTLCDCTH